MAKHMLKQGEGIRGDMWLHGDDEVGFSFVITLE